MATLGAAPSNAGLPIANLATGTDGELITWDSSGDPAAVAVGTATNVLTSNGVGAAPTFQAAAAGGFTKGMFSTDFETAARKSVGSVGTGSVITDASSPLALSTGATATSAQEVLVTNDNNSLSWYGDDPEIHMIAAVSQAPTVGESFFGLGNFAITGGSLTYTIDQMGFKIIYAAGTAVLSATNANGSSETATDITAGNTVTAALRYVAVKDSTTNIKFYVGSTLEATHTTNLPDSATSNHSFMVSNAGQANDFRIRAQHSTMIAKYA